MRKCIISAVGAATRPKKRRSAEIDPEMALRDAGNGTEGEEGWGGVNVEGCRGKGGLGRGQCRGMPEMAPGVRRAGEGSM